MQGAGKGCTSLKRILDSPFISYKDINQVRDEVQRRSVWISNASLSNVISALGDKSGKEQEAKAQIRAEVEAGARDYGG